MPFADVDEEDLDWATKLHPRRDAGTLEQMAHRYAHRPDTPLTRVDQLRVFVEYMTEFLRDSAYVILVQIQSATEVREKRFNRGKLLNLGFQEAERFGCDVVCFHDVDLLPPPRLRELYLTAPTAQPVHLGALFERYAAMKQYFGGVLLMTMSQFRGCQGFPNTVWGWGYEDSSLYMRLQRCAQYERSRDPAFQLAVSQPKVRYLDLEYLPDYVAKKHMLDQTRAKCPVQYELRDREQQGGFWVFDTLATAAEHATVLASIDVSSRVRLRVWRLGKNEDVTDVA